MFFFKFFVFFLFYAFCGFPNKDNLTYFKIIRVGKSKYYRPNSMKSFLRDWTNLKLIESHSSSTKSIIDSKLDSVLYILFQINNNFPQQNHTFSNFFYWSHLQMPGSVIYFGWKWSKKHISKWGSWGAPLPLKENMIFFIFQLWDPPHSLFALSQLKNLENIWTYKRTIKFRPWFPTFVC